MSVLPETRYAFSGEVGIAYQVVGEGFLRRLAGFPRLIDFDRRGVGLSERRGLVEFYGVGATPLTLACGRAPRGAGLRGLGRLCSLWL